MIKENTPLSMAEVQEYIGGKKESEAELKIFIKKFINLDPKQAKELKEKLEATNMIKIKPMHIVKIIDLIPEDRESLNKIFTDVSLNEDEAKQILDEVEKFR